MTDHPAIQYSRNVDGRRIAYYTMGSGEPSLLALPAHPSVSIAKEWETFPQNRIVAQFTSRVRKYVRFDVHGSGESDRDASDFSIDSFVRDIESVADATERQPFILFGAGQLAAPALAFVARHPERVTHVVLWGAQIDPRQTPSILESMTELALSDWRMATESWCRALENWESEATASKFAAMTRESMTPEAFVKFERERRAWDVSDCLPMIAAPTLIIHPRNHPYLNVDGARELAATIPGARLALVEGATVSFGAAEILKIAGEFLGVVPSREVPGQQPVVPSTEAVVVLFTDIADSTALTERLGDRRFREASRALDAGLRAAIHDAGGAAVDGKLLGDGVLAAFPSAAQAIDGARQCLAVSAASELGLHIGLHAGDVIREENNLFGGAVNIAARICALSAPGEILVSDVVRGMARSSAGVGFEDRGEQAMKGIDEPVRVFAVRAAE